MKPHAKANAVLSQALRVAKRKAIIHEHFGPRYNRGPLGATIAFESDGGTALLDQTEFQSKVLKGVEGLESRFKSFETKVETQQRQLKGLEDKQAEILSAMPKDIKKTLEEIEALKKNANDQQANQDKLVKLINKFDKDIRNHARFGFANPIERVKADEDMRDRLNIAIRLMFNKGTALLNERLKARAKELSGVEVGQLFEMQRALGEANVKGVVGETKALGEDSSPGSLLIDDRLATEIYDTLATFGVWNTFQVDRVSNQTVKYPVTTARPTASFILTESSAISDASFTGTSVNNVMEVIAVLINVSLQLLQDAEYDLTGYIMGHFAEAYAERLDHACLGADGTADATNGGMTGVFVGGTAATADAGAGADDTVEELEFEDWTRCLTTVDPVVLQRMAKWWMHPQILVRALSIKDLNGRPIFLTALEAPAARSIGTILGYPVVPALKAPSTNSANQKVAVFGDPAGLVVGVRSDYMFGSSDDFRWANLDRSFRGWGRAGTKIRRALAFAMLTLGA